MPSLFLRDEMRLARADQASNNITPHTGTAADKPTANRGQ
jgi:hypothetical protein